MGDFNRYLLYQKELTESKLKTISRFLNKIKQESPKRTSKTVIVENVLKIAGRPLHISKIIEIAKRDFDVQLERDSITSILTKKIKAGQKFIRTSPNTFALKE